MERVHYKKKFFSLAIFVFLCTSYFFTLYIIKGEIDYKTLIVSFMVLIPIWIYYIKSFEKFYKPLYFSKDGITIINGGSEQIFIQWNDLYIDPKIKRSVFTFSKTIEIKSTTDSNFSEILTFDMIEGESLKMLIKKYTPKEHELYKSMIKLRLIN